MKKVKTEKLRGPALDWAVGCLEGEKPVIQLWPPILVVRGKTGKDLLYSQSWQQGGPIIERENIELRTWALDGWEAHTADYSHRPDNDEVFAQVWAKTPLVAAMRCYVASRIGDEIEIPEALVSFCTGD